MELLGQLFNGIVLGLSLAILVGPLIFAIIQATLERGFYGGFFVAGGIWFSDLLFIIFTFLGLNLLLKLSKWEPLSFYLSVFGGLVLIIIGIGIVFSRTASMSEDKKHPKWTGINFFIKGFLINTINPFTIFFWLSVMTVSFDSSNGSIKEPLVFSAGIFATILLTDSIKVIFAKKLRSWLTDHQVDHIRKISGMVFIVFGLVLLVKDFFI